MMVWKNPESVLVLILAKPARCLLLERADWPGFWQSVTGSLEKGETPLQAAVRELFEETGFKTEQGLLRDAGYSEPFDIFPRYRYRYEPHVTQGVSHVFWFILNEEQPPILSKEHARYVWVSAEEALSQFFSETNRSAMKHWLTLEGRL